MPPSDKFQLAVSQALYLEYKEVLMRPEIRPPGTSEADVEGFIDRILLYSETRDIHFSWRPTLRDPDDEMVLEVAVSYQAEYIVTYNIKDFVGVELFGIECIRPNDFLKLVM
jgi:predicted nucleic acid-binding protein